MFETRGVSKFGEIFWRVLGSFFIVEHLGCKTLCFRKNGLGDKHDHICEEVNEAKYLGYDIYLTVSFLNYFFFALVLKCGGLDILVLGGRNVMAPRDLLRLVNPALLNLG